MSCQVYQQQCASQAYSVLNHNLEN